MMQETPNKQDGRLTVGRMLLLCKSAELVKPVS